MQLEGNATTVTERSLASGVRVNVMNSSPSRGAIANEVKQSHEIATLARRNVPAYRSVAALLAMTSLIDRVAFGFGLSFMSHLLLGYREAGDGAGID